MGFNDLFLRF